MKAQKRCHIIFHISINGWDEAESESKLGLFVSSTKTHANSDNTVQQSSTKNDHIMLAISILSKLQQAPTLVSNHGSYIVFTISNILASTVKTLDFHHVDYLYNSKMPHSHTKGQRSVKVMTSGTISFLAMRFFSLAF